MPTPVKPGDVTVGWIGTGVMGRHMAIHVLNKGFNPMMVYNRTAWKTKPIVEAGAKHAQTVRELAEASDIVFTMVGFPSDVREVIAGEDGVLKHIRQGGIVIDLTTSDPALACELADMAASQGKQVLDTPVTGGDVGAKNGQLSVMVGGDRDTVMYVRPLIECFAKKITYMGEAGSGQHCKLANQVTIASTMIGMCEGLMYAYSSGLDLEMYLGAIGQGAAGSFSITAYAPQILKGNMRPGFFVEHFVKDLGLAIQCCQSMKISLPGLALAQQLYVSMMAHGEEKLGTQALIKVIERLNNKKLPTAETFDAW